MSILPPFEGWDEYQHLSYLYYLEENGERPILKESIVSRNFIETMVHYPAPVPMVNQLKSTGIVGYKTFFDTAFEGPQYKQNHNDIGIYQAQHGIIYYALMMPIFKNFNNPENLNSLISILRLLNIIFSLLTVALVLWLINQLFDNKPLIYAASLLVVCHPFLMLNSCRVANDAFAILTGTVVIALGLSQSFRNKYISAILAGLFIGISCWAKSVSAILFPFWFFSLYFAWKNEEISTVKMLAMLLLSYLISFATLTPYFIFNISHYDMLFVMQESIVNKNNNKTLFDIITAQPIFAVFRDILLKWSEESIWHGGWSYLRVRDVRNIVKVLMIFSFLGWLYHYYKRKSFDQIEMQSLLLCFSLVILTSMALSWHSLQSSLAWGYSSTNPWYICISLPFFLIFLTSSAFRWSDKAGFITIILLSAVYMYSDLRGMITMIYYYSGGNHGFEALNNISFVHPNWLGTPVLLISFCLIFFLMWISLLIIIKSNSQLLVRKL